MRLDKTHARPQVPAPRGTRRGTIIVLALAVLAIISIAALSYVSIVRIDRSSTAAVASSVNYHLQVESVQSYIGALLTADLFGGAIVTNTVPKFDGNGNPIWPRAFQDGETWDYPHADLDWVANPEFYSKSGGFKYDPNHTNMFRRIARPEDAWLASPEPRWQQNLANTSVWPQVSNIRSALTWYPVDSTTDTGFWVRGDGRFVDLREWFDKKVDGRGNPRLDLLGLPTTPAEFRGEFIGPEGGIWNPANSGDELLSTAVFDLQMADLGEDAPPGMLTNIDQRLWADTNGDLRPDARWTQMPELLGNLYGLNWVVAVRITDASGLANINAHLEFPYTADILRMGTGQTPADFDLFGLLAEGANSSDFDAPVSTAQLPFQFRDHLENTLGISMNMVNQINAAEDQYEVQPYTGWSFGQPLTRDQRRGHYDHIGNAPDRSNIGAANYYRDTDLIDLNIYWGTNSSALSRIEERLDGPENGGFLPGPNGTGDFGVMRSAETSDARHFDGPLGSGQPSSDRLYLDTRRLLTTRSGEGLFSPIPVANRYHPDFLAGSLNEKVILPRLIATADAGKLTNPEMMSVLSATAFALLPEASQHPVFADSLADPPDVTDHLAYYGGSVGGPAEMAMNELTTPAAIGSAYAFLRAVALALNIIDASDDEFLGGTTDDAPTVVRVWNQAALTIGLYENGPHATPEELILANTITDDPGVLELNTVFPFGTIHDQTLPEQYLGTRQEGVTMVGLERQPFLTEAVCFVAYNNGKTLELSGGPDIGGTPSDNVELNTGDAANFMGALIGIEVANPWPDPIDVTNFRLELTGQFDDIAPTEGRRISIDLGHVDPELDKTIAPGSRTMFWIPLGQPGAVGADGQVPNPDAAWDVLVDTWRGINPATHEDSTVPPAAVTVFDGDYFEVPDYSPISANMAKVPQLLHELVAGVGGTVSRDSATVLLIRKGGTWGGAGTGTGQFDLLIDRMSGPDNLGGADPVFPVSGLSDQGVGQQFVSDSLCAEGAPPPVGGFRLAFTSALHRPDGRGPGSPQGFPAYVLEDRAQNTVLPETTSTPQGFAWHINPGTCPPIGEGAALDLIAFANTALDDTPKQDFQMPAGAPALPGFQLFVPDAPLKTKADLLMVSAFAHMYYNTQTAPPPLTPFDKRWVLDAWDTDRVRNFTESGDPSPRGAWFTLSEQLARPSSLLYMQAANFANPYVGVLDPTRDMLGDTTLQWPDNRAPEVYGVPPALRLLDCFEVIDPISDLVEGRININSAGHRVLRHIPFMAPSQPIISSAGSTLNADPGYPGTRVLAVERHRDRIDFSGAQTSPWQDTNLQQFRNTNQVGPGANQARGFITAAELANNDVFQAVPALIQPGTGRFATLGADSVANDGLPLESYFNGGTPPFDEQAFGDLTYNPIDDPAERTAIYRAMSNIVTSRSDIFFATFIIRGYDPASIDGIEIDAEFGGNAEAAMDSEEFLPTYESRWLAVYDRSGVRIATDRPKLLKLIELPPARP